VVAPGTSGTIGTLTAGATTMISTTTFKFDLNSDAGSADKLMVNGALVLGNATFSGTDLGSTILQAGTVFDVAQYTSLTGTFANLANGAAVNIGANEFTINYGTTPDEITLTDVAAVPEPRTWVMMLGGLVVLVAGWRRQRYLV
jgi:hypothetical protein